MRSLSFFLLPLAIAGCSDPVRPPVSTDLGAAVDAVADVATTDIPTADRPTATDVPVAPTDVATDVTNDRAIDVPADRSDDVVASDVPTDLPTDVPIDAGFDGAADVASEAGLSDASDAAAPFDDSGLGAWFPLGDETCGARARRVVALAGSHVDPDAGPIAWLTNPPSSGNHFGNWARWGAWPDLARGHWVHNLEHGGVAFLYRCASTPCAATRDALVAVMNALPPDPACMPTDAEPTRARVVITNDNVITSPIAAAAWGAVYEATCVDGPSLRQFFTMFAGHAPEDFCFEGQVP